MFTLNLTPPPEGKVWEGMYDAKGQVTYKGTLPGSETFDLGGFGASGMDSARRLTLVTLRDRQARFSMSLDMTSWQGESFRRFNLTLPTPGHSSSLTTYSFSLDSPLPFMSMPVGGPARSALATGGDYRLRITRPTPGRWVIQAAGNGGSQEAVRVQLDLTPAAPPWTTIALAFSGSAPEGSVSGHLRFDRRPDREAGG